MEYPEYNSNLAGLKLKTEEIKDALRSSHVFVVALISSLFVTGSIVAAITEKV